MVTKKAMSQYSYVTWSYRGERGSWIVGDLNLNSERVDISRDFQFQSRLLLKHLVLKTRSACVLDCRPMVDFK